MRPNTFYDSIKNIQSRSTKPCEEFSLGSFFLRADPSGAARDDGFARALGVLAEPVLMDSQAEYAVLAAGKGDLLLRLIRASKPDYRCPKISTRPPAL